jgi:hypothetical protein
MNYSNTINNKKINTLLSIFVTSALILAPLLASDNAFAQSIFFPTFSNVANSATQGISQGQSNTQNALCLSGALTGAACNNTSTQGQVNTGSNAAAQQGGSSAHGSGSGGHHKKGNSATQGISQGQSNTQNAQCVSGSSTSGSCNNTSVQGQSNSGSNAVAQKK